MRGFVHLLTLGAVAILSGCSAPDDSGGYCGDMPVNPGQQCVDLATGKASAPTPTPTPPQPKPPSAVVQQAPRVSNPATEPTSDPATETPPASPSSTDRGQGGASGVVSSLAGAILPVTISGDATATLFDPQPNGSARCFLGWNGGGAGNSEARITLSASWPPGYQGRGRVVYVAGPPYSPASTPAYLVLDFQIQNGSLTISSPIHISGGVPTTVDDAMQIWAPGHTVYSFAFTPNQ